MLAMAAFGGTAHAATPWSAPLTVASPADGVTAFDATLTDDGLAVAVWRRGTGGSAQLEAAVRPAGAGAWGLPTPIAGPATLSAPQVVAGGSGRALVTWLEGGLRSRAYDPATGWGATETVAGTSALTDYHVAMGATGASAAAGLTSGAAAVAAYRPAGGSWEAATALTVGSDTGLAADVAVGPGGDAWALWQREVGGAGLLSSRHAAGPGAWGSNDIVSGGAGLSGGQIFAHAGGAIAVWSGVLPAGATRANAAPAWSSMDMGAQPPVPFGHILQTTDAAVDPVGRLMLAVADRNLQGTPGDPSDDVLTPVGVRSRSAAGVWDGVAEASLAAPLPGRVVAAGPGVFLLVSGSAPSTTATQRYANLLGTESVEPPQTVTAESQSADIAGDHDGHGLAAWTADAGGVTVLRAAGTRPVTPPATEPPPVQPPAGGTSPPKPTPLPAVRLSGLVRLPATSGCLRRRRLIVTARHPAGVTIVAITLKVRGRPRRVLSGRTLRAPVTLTKLPKGRIHLSITVKLADGRSISGARTYRACAARS